MEDVFYVIRMISPSGERGYLFDSKDGIKIITEMRADVTQFQTFDEATAFIREHKLERRGVRAYAIDSNALLDDKLFMQGTDGQEVYFIENDAGQKVFFNAKEGVHFFRKADVGFCCWKDDDNLRNMVKELEDQNFTVFVKPMSSFKK